MQDLTDALPGFGEAGTWMGRLAVVDGCRQFQCRDQRLFGRRLEGMRDFAEYAVGGVAAAQLVERQAEKLQGNQVAGDGGQHAAGDDGHLARVAGLIVGAEQVDQGWNHGCSPDGFVCCGRCDSSSVPKVPQLLSAFGDGQALKDGRWPEMTGA